MITILQTNPYESMNSGDAGAAMALGFGTMVLYLFFFLFFGFCFYKIFKKAGRDDAWAGFVPIYQNYVLVDIIKKPILWFIMLFIPFVNIIFIIMILDRLSKFFGKTSLFTVLMIFLPFIALPILAFGSAQYNPAALPDDRNK